MFKNTRRLNFVDQIGQLYSEPFTTPPMDQVGKKFLPVTNVTFQITNDCCCECTYCYQINKKHEMMTKETAKKCVDRIFEMYDDPNSKFFNKDVNKGIELEFIGGEPLMNIEVIDYICTYFYEKCIELHHPWAYRWMCHMISNGAYYFSDAFQNFLKKFNGHCYYNVSIDGPEEMHNTCRIYHDGTGNFKDAWNAIHHYRENYNDFPTTKVTIAPENLDQLDKIVSFFIDDSVFIIHANVIYEHCWTEEEGATFYKKLKAIADFLLPLDNDYYFSILSEQYYQPIEESVNQNWCGGDGRMIAFDPNGDAYPCLRYMETSLNGEREPIKIGNCTDGVYKTEKEKKIQEDLNAITRRSQSTDECFNCPIAAGCSWCTAWNYQQTGSFNVRSTNNCNMHKAASLAAVYFWNKYYQKYNINKSFRRYLPDEEALKFISQEELSMLNDLEKINN